MAKLGAVRMVWRQSVLERGKHALINTCSEDMLDRKAGQGVAKAKPRDTWRGGVDLGPMMNNVTASGLGQRAHPGCNTSINPFAPLLANTGLRSPMSAYLFDVHSAGKAVVRKLHRKASVPFQDRVYHGTVSQEAVVPNFKITHIQAVTEHV
jgi:hypothetical protein